MEGSWTPTQSTLNFYTSDGGFGYGWMPAGAEPGGGLVIAKAGDCYSVTLVSVDGKRFTADDATRQGALLRVEWGGVQFFISQSSPDRLQLMPGQFGKPDRTGAVDLRPGAPGIAQAGSQSPAPMAP